ncbi:MAG: TOBE domain-containing protein, partial [Hydrogenophaga sp.]
PCEVLGAEPVSPDDPTVLIRLRTAGGAVLVASVTRESADLLALQPGTLALVLCKATAVTVTAGQPVDPAAPNRLCGRIDRIAKGQGRDEVVIGLDGGGQWVGFAAHPFQARRGQRVCAVMDTAALVIALSS